VEVCEGSVFFHTETSSTIPTYTAVLYPMVALVAMRWAGFFLIALYHSQWLSVYVVIVLWECLFLRICCTYCTVDDGL